MKSVLWVAIAWAVVSIVVGLLGDFWLSHAWRGEAVASFLRDSEMGRQLVEGKNWDKPVESNPGWQNFEETLNLDMLPGPKVDTLERTSGNSTPASVEWSSIAAGRYRLSVVMPAVLSGERTGLRFTRELSGSSLRGWWWSMWGITQIVGATIAIQGLRMGLFQLARQRNLLTPWLSALQLDARSDRLLPPIEELESELEPSLTLIAERVNRTVAELGNYKQRSDLVLGNLQEGVLAVDERSGVLLANNALLKLLDIQDISYLNRPLLEIIRVPMVSQLIDQVLKQKVSREEAFNFGTPERQLRLQAKPLPLGGDRVGALMTVRDETMLKRVESIRRDFVTNASHELKTPLAAIRAYAETLQMGAIEDREAAEGFVANIIAQADRINGLVQGMLQLSRVQSGTGLRIESFEATEALEPCLAAVSAMAKSKGVLLHNEFPPEGIKLQSDRDGFETIVSNLLSNAVRYTPEGGRVTLSLYVNEPWLVVVVEDTGIGIQKADLDRIFERFYRAEKDRSADTGGTGLGLSIVKNLVQALDGTVSAMSEPKQGSRFEVRLPLKQVNK